MPSVKTHLKSNYGALAEHHRALSKDFQTLASQQEDSKIEKVFTSLATRFDALAGHFSNMAQAAEMLPAEGWSQRPLIPALTERQPYLDRPAAKAVGSDAIVDDHVRGVIGPMPDIRAVPRAGQPPIDASRVAPQFRKFVTVEDEEQPA